MPQYNKLHEFLRTRRSIRHFKPQTVPKEVLECIMESATWAPSAHNRQPWRFAVLTTLEVKTHLADEMGVEFQKDLLADGLSMEEVQERLRRSRSRILHAPAVIILCLDTQDMDEYPDAERNQAEYIMAVQSLALAGGTLLLAAHAEGLGGVWMCAPLFAPETVRRVLNLPPGWQPQGMVLLGYPAHVPEPPPRRNFKEMSIFM